MKVRFFEDAGKTKIEIEVSRTTIIVREARQSDIEAHASQYQRFIDGVPEVVEVVHSPVVPVDVKPEEPSELKSLDDLDSLPEVEQVIDLDIFPNGVTKSLREAGFVSVDELTEVRLADVEERTKGLGPKRLQDMQDVMTAHGLSFAE